MSSTYPYTYQLKQMSITNLVLENKQTENTFYVP